MLIYVADKDLTTFLMFFTAKRNVGASSNTNIFQLIDRSEEWPISSIYRGKQIEKTIQICYNLIKEFVKIKGSKSRKGEL